jgi:hypothetical protein
LNYYSSLGLTVFAAALFLCGCTGVPSRTAFDYAEPPAWNLLERMITDTEIVSADPAGENAPASEHASAYTITPVRPSS